MLTGFGSREWLEAFIRDASHTRFYGERNDRIPAFGPDEIASEAEVGLLVGWLGRGGTGDETRVTARWPFGATLSRWTDYELG